MELCWQEMEQGLGKLDLALLREQSYIRIMNMKCE